MALKSFYVALNSTSGRVGLAPIQPNTKKNDNCKMVERCLKGQTYYRPSNVCLEPNCEAYYFMTLNEDKHECRTVRIEEMIMIMTSIRLPLYCSGVLSFIISV